MLNTIIGTMLGFIMLALAFCGLPLLPLAYAALAIGRTLAGETGMIVGASIGMLIASSPFLYLCLDLARRLAKGWSLVPVYADQYGGYILLGTSTITIFATAALFAIVWPTQLARASNRARSAL